MMQVRNIQLGIPVRVIRKNPDRDAMYGSVFVYDGLYNVVSLLCMSVAQRPSESL